jgi:hypothetical protein
MLQPELAKLNRDWVIEARDGLNDADRRASATTALRAMVEGMIVLTPEGDALAIPSKGDFGGDAGGCCKSAIRFHGLETERAPVRREASRT